MDPWARDIGVFRVPTKLIIVFFSIVAFNSESGGMGSPVLDLRTEGIWTQIIWAIFLELDRLVSIVRIVDIEMIIGSLELQ